MAHFAEINSDNIVTRVLVVPDDQEHRGQAFLAEDLRLGGDWIRTSYSSSIRGRFAAPAMIYEPDLDIFISPRPYPSWTLDREGDWQAPVAMPDDGTDYVWDEEAQAWTAIEVVE